MRTEHVKAAPRIARESVAPLVDLLYPPRCPVCRAVVRPSVVLFGEALPAAAFARFEDELARGFDAVVVVGTSAMFPYVARPVLVAKSEGVPTIEINPGVTDLSDVKFAVLESGGTISIVKA